MRHAALFICLILLACENKPAAEQKNQAANQLDEQAIAAGILPDAASLSLSGQFETRSELGIDKFCAINAGNGYDIGVLAVFGPESKCEARGTARLTGDHVEISLSGEESCKFNAEYDGVELRFPGAMEEGCLSYCSPRASFSGTSYFLVSNGDDAARKSLGRELARLCGQ